MACMRTAVFNVVVLSAGFALLFAAYNTVQGYATTLLGDLGSLSLSVLYITVAVGVPFAPGVIKLVGAKAALVLGAACYVVYLASLITGSPGLIIAGSVVIGLGSAALWVAFGVITNANAEDDAFGTFAGWFWTGLQTSNVAGNLVAFGVLTRESRSPGLFAGLAGTGLAGVLVLMGLSWKSKKPSDGDGDADTDTDGDGNTKGGGSINRAKEKASRATASEDSVGMLGLAVRSICMLGDRRLRFLLPLFFLTGAELAYWSGSLPLLVQEDRVGLLLALVGVGDVIGGALFGWLGDRIGRAAVVAIGCMLLALGTVSTLIMALMGAGSDGVARVGPAIADVPILAFAGGLCYGLGDASLNTQSYAALGDIFESSEAGRDEAAMANTVLQLLNNIGSAAGFFAAIPFPLVDKTHANGAFSVNSVATATAILALSVLTAASTYCAKGIAPGTCGQTRGLAADDGLKERLAPILDDADDDTISI